MDRKEAMQLKSYKNKKIKIKEKERGSGSCKDHRGLPGSLCFSREWGG